MADTLEEIYKATLSESDFNSNGVKEIFTTNSSTRYMIKDVQVVNSSEDIPVKADLTINDVKVASIDASVSGTEIVGISSSVKVDSSTFPLDYEDQYFAISPVVLYPFSLKYLIFGSCYPWSGSSSCSVWS